jgi:RNA polymerase sigma-70 factor (ECF subfamily)
MAPVNDTPEDRDVVAAAVSGDEAAFAALTRRYRRELHVHCYRILGSFEDAEDLVQETFLRAWQKRASFEGRGSFRAWLYRIATNCCLDFLAKHKREVAESATAAGGSGPTQPPEVPWLQPYPDRLLDEVAPSSDEPDAALIARETIELAYIVALQVLPAKQRAALILCDVLDWSAQEAATLLEATVPSLNGALRRARATLRERRRTPEQVAVSPGERAAQERALLQQYVAAAERCDPEALVRLLRDDARWSMPPEPGVWVGGRTMVDAWVTGGLFSPPYDDFRWVVTRANRMPALVCYVKRPGERDYTPLSMDVLRIDAGLVAEITTFGVKERLDAFALPPTLL